MEETKISFNELILYVTVANVVLGFLFGSFPLICGLRMKNQKYAWYGFIGSIIGGALLGIFLSYPIAVIFTWLIMKKSLVGESGDTVNVNENPAKFDAENTEIR